ncbi:hypothetical protein K2173_011475 [Erythroxylum novogranatense]|uniref:Uncharacterized protein n=1 Tax=Erythroxylum novogranatense TaxID=1862640 RepID=A0AAV8TG29_9ROSI|nr:hypothetical protein K2173_011475 [Erythroxylum novogranatense]
MGRAPCCEKTGLNKGPWTPEEDKLLISYIQKHGHSNWRALPKQAGLLRCGKSCRLRWINYLRPDIKRGNFSIDEEETIIQLHEMLGNRWSAIAARLPGRTDNEIKNVWHTHLKKKIKQKQYTDSSQHVITDLEQYSDLNVSKLSEREKSSNHTFTGSVGSPAGCVTMSPQPSFSEQSSSSETSVAMAKNNLDMLNGEVTETCEMFPVIDEYFWSEHMMVELTSNSQDESQYTTTDVEGPSDDDCMGFWYNLLINSGGFQESL